MSAGVKRVLNRGGLFVMAAGVVMILVGGGDVGAALDIAGKVASIGGTVLVLIRELLN